jgi:hypothetical protein
MRTLDRQRRLAAVQAHPTHAEVVPVWAIDAPEIDAPTPPARIVQREMWVVTLACRQAGRTRRVSGSAAHPAGSSRSTRSRRARPSATLSADPSSSRGRLSARTLGDQRVTLRRRAFYMIGGQR